jgi:hypothetical protein
VNFNFVGPFGGPNMQTEFINIGVYKDGCHASIIKYSISIGRQIWKWVT